MRNQKNRPRPIRYLNVNYVIYLFITFFWILLPFNITKQFRVDDYSSPYVRGMLINYLIPTITITDLTVLALFILLIINLFQSEWSNIRRSFEGTKLEVIKQNLSSQLLLIVIITFYFLCHILYFHSLLTTFIVLRYWVYIVTGILFISLLNKQVVNKNYWLQFNNPKSIGKAKNFGKDGKQQRTGFLFINKFPHKLYLAVYLLPILIQCFIGVQQVSRGSWLGLKWLGESTVSAQAPGASFIDIGGSIFLRAYGTFPHPNILAGYILLCFLILIFLIRQKVFSRWEGIIISTLLLFTISLTLTRLGIMLGLLCYLIILLESLGLNPRSKLGSYTIDWKSTSPSTQSPFRLTNLMFTLPQSLITSAQERVDLMFVAWEVIRNNLITGVGIGQFIYNIGESKYLPTVGPGIPLLQPVHNIFLLILSENGVIFGGVILLTIIFYMIKGFKRSQDPYFSGIVITLFLIVGSADHYLLTLSQGFAFLIVGTLILYLPTVEYINLSETT